VVILKLCAVPLEENCSQNKQPWGSALRRPGLWQTANRISMLDRLNWIRSFRHQTFSADWMLLSAYRNGKLRYFGHSGTGFSEKGLAEAIDRLRPFFTNKPPVENPARIPEKIQWVAPKLVCEVAFAEWTEDEQLRQTTFLGWRDDKDPKDVVL
jgi:ATP dependent DNA ligase C terminal region